jgi:hypothetical protein
MDRYILASFISLLILTLWLAGGWIDEQKEHDYLQKQAWILLERAENAFTTGRLEGKAAGYSEAMTHFYQETGQAIRPPFEVDENRTINIFNPGVEEIQAFMYIQYADSTVARIGLDSAAIENVQIYFAPVDVMQDSLFGEWRKHSMGGWISVGGMSVNLTSVDSAVLTVE